MYKVIITSSAKRDLKSLPKDIYLLVAKALRNLKVEARPHGCTKISGSTNDWRIRIGKYRIVYEIDDNNLIIKVYRIKHRKEAYRKP